MIFLPHFSFSHDAECAPRCTGRCSKTAYKKPCMLFCQKCCAKCLCVPPGTYGNKQVCPCYNNWKTKRGGPKCPWIQFNVKFSGLTYCIPCFATFYFIFIQFLDFLISWWGGTMEEKQEYWESEFFYKKGTKKNSDSLGSIRLYVSLIYNLFIIKFYLWSFHW